MEFIKSKYFYFGIISGITEHTLSFIPRNILDFIQTDTNINISTSGFGKLFNGSKVFPSLRFSVHVDIPKSINDSNITLNVSIPRHAISAVRRLK